MADSIFCEDHDVVPLLQDIDLDRAGLIEACRYADSERALCTGNDANGFAQMTVYDKAARALREIFGGKLWEKDDTNNQAGIRHRTKKIRIVPCNFDENAGNRLLQPTNRSPKGEVSRAKARCNGTGWLPGLPDIPAQDRSEIKTWVLGIHSVEQRPLAAELSFPLAFDGFFYTRFHPRVILLRGDEPSGGARRGHEGGRSPTDIVDIAIVRR